MRRLLSSALISSSLTLAGKDFRVFFRDRTGMLLAFALPIGLVSVFGFVTQFALGGGDAMPKAELWAVDEDGSELSAALVENLRQAETVRLRPRQDEEARGRENARELLETGEAHHVLLIEPGFGDAVARGEVPALTLLRDPGRTMEDQLVRLGLMQAMMATTQGRLLPAMLGRQLGAAGVPGDVVRDVVEANERQHSALDRHFAGQALGGGAGAAAFDFQSFFTDVVPVTEVEVAPPARRRTLTYTLAQSVSGVTVMMLMFGLVAAGGTLIREREQGTLPRLLVAAAPRDAVLFGKFLFAAGSGLMQLAALFVWGDLLFRVGMFQKPLTLAVIAVTVTAAVTAFGVLIAAWARTTKQAEGVSTLLILGMSALGGAWFPVQIFDLPVYAEAITRCTLTWWAMSAFQQMLWNQASWTAPPVLQALGVLWAFALAASFFAWRLYRSRYANG
jgi:ABC-2 type transport system permease protein